MAARNLVYSLNRKQESGLREWNRRLAVAFPEVLQPFRCVSHPSRYMVLTIPGVATLRRDPDQRALGTRKLPTRRSPHPVTAAPSSACTGLTWRGCTAWCGG